MLGVYLSWQKTYLLSTHETLGSTPTTTETRSTRACLEWQHLGGRGRMVKSSSSSLATQQDQGYPGLYLSANMNRALGFGWCSLFIPVSAVACRHLQEAETVWEPLLAFSWYVPRPGSGLSICSSEWGIPPLCCFPKKMRGLQLVSGHEKLLCSIPSNYMVTPHLHGLCRSPTIFILSLSLCSEQGGQEALVSTLHPGVRLTTCSFLPPFAPGVGSCCLCVVSPA